MKAAEFIKKVNAIDYDEELAAFAGKLVEAGVLEADDNQQPEPEPRRVEVEGVTIEEGEDGDLDICLDGDHVCLLIDEEVAAAGRIARALLAWVAAGEPQEQPQAAPEPFSECREIGLLVKAVDPSPGDTIKDFTLNEVDGPGSIYLNREAVRELAEYCGVLHAAPEPARGTRERPYIWQRRTESGGTEEVPVWLEQAGERIRLYLSGNDLDPAISFLPDHERPMRVVFARSYSGPKDAAGRVLFVNDDLPQPAAQPQPEAGEVVLRLTREEAEALRQLIDDKVGGPPSGPRGLFDRISNKLEGANVRAAEHAIEGPSLYLR